jgi:hypothetical protein
VRRVALVVGFFALLAGTARAASPGLVLTKADVPGFRPARSTAAAARAAFGPAALRGHTQRAHFSKGKADVWSVTALAKTPAGASRLLAGTKRRAQLRFVRVHVGDAGFAVRGKSAIVLWRTKNAVGEILVTGPRSPAVLADAAISYAGLLDGRISFALSETLEQRLLDQIKPNGVVPRSTALGLFALAYGPLPGTKRPAGTAAPMEEGTLAGRLILQIWPTLSRAQRTAALKKLGLRSVRLRHVRSVDRLQAAAGPPDYGDPGFTETAELDKLANSLAGEYAKLLPGGNALKAKIVAGTTTKQETTVTGGLAAADAYPADANGNLTDSNPYCRIRVQPAGQKEIATNYARRYVLIAHEVFHCFQFQIMTPSGALLVNRRNWLLEGSADWAAQTLTEVPWDVGVGETSFTEYLEKPQVPLFERAYDAVGFFGHTQEVSGDEWSRIVTMLKTGTSEETYAKAGADATGFLNSWASSTFNFSAIGSDWTMTQPIQIPDGTKPTETPIWAGAGFVKAEPYTYARYLIHLPDDDVGGPLLHVRIYGHARLANTSFDRTDLEDAWFCMEEADKCKCPPNEIGTPPPSTPLGRPRTALALTGGRTGTFGILTPETLENFCRKRQEPPKPKPKPPKKKPCRADCGVDNGDPHMTTFDGLYYDFMAAGEFVLARSSKPGFEIQVRQVPYPGSKVLSVNSAVAMRVGRDRVVVTKGVPLTVRLNGAGFVPTRQYRTLPSGGRIRRVEDPTLIGRTSDTDQIEVVWPDGSLARLWQIEDWGVNVLVRPSAAERGKLRGLLGNFDGTTDDDIVTRSGRRLKPGLLTTDIKGAYRLRYRVFGDSWRIRQGESLFDYARGQSTRTFTNRSFPEKFVDTSTLPLQARRTAERACKRLGITNRHILAACILDVAGTGNFSFALASSDLQRTAPGLGARGHGGGKPPVPGASKWKRITPASEKSSDLPSLALDGGKVVVAYRVDGKTLEAATFTPSVAKGVTGLRRDPIGSGWTDVGLPFLLPRAGGGLQALATGDGAPLNGTGFAPRNADGSFGPFTLASNARGAEVQGQGVLARDGAPLWPGSVAGDLEVWRGVTGPASNVLSSSFSPPLANGIPSIGRDNAGRYWIAWAASGPLNQPALSGFYLMQFDPTTLQAIGQRAHAPNTETAGTGRLTMACAATCRLVYGVGTKVYSWAPGEAAATVVASATGGVGTTVAAAYADSRLWVAWEEEKDGDYHARLGDARGAGGQAVALGRPANGVKGGLAGITVGNDLVLVLSWYDKNWARYVDVVSP